jgi:glycosyltransferase involved in cell wall biosynthesis
MKISYITVTRWWDARIPWLIQGEASLAIQQDVADCEWIIVSEFKSKPVLHGYLPTKLLHTPELTTVAKKMNRGIAEAQGDYIAFLDDDNRKGYQFDQIPNFMRRWDYRACYCFGNWIDERGIVTGIHQLPTANYAEIWQQGGFFYNEGLVAEKALLDEVGGLDEELEAGEDYDLALRLMRAGNLGLLGEYLVEMRSGHADMASRDPYFTGHRTQDALHRILRKHGRMNWECPFCKRNLRDLPYDQTRVRWSKEHGNTWRRVCEECQDK